MSDEIETDEKEWQEIGERLGVKPVRVERLPFRPGDPREHTIPDELQADPEYMELRREAFEKLKGKR